MPSKTLILTSCCKEKLRNPAPAQDLYQGALFQLVRQYASETGSDWRILSAKYGLVEPYQVLEPYDLQLRGRAMIDALQKTVLPALAAIWNNYALVVVIMGIHYRQVIYPILHRQGYWKLDPHVNVAFVHDERGIGGLLQKVKFCIAEFHAEREREKTLGSTPVKEPYTRLVSPDTCKTCLYRNQSFNQFRKCGLPTGEDNPLSTPCDYCLKFEGIENPDHYHKDRTVKPMAEPTKNEEIKPDEKKEPEPSEFGHICAFCEQPIKPGTNMVQDPHTNEWFHGEHYGRDERHKSPAPEKPARKPKKVEIHEFPKVPNLPDVIMVNVSEINVGTRLRREPQTPEERAKVQAYVQKLADSIEDQGLLHPITIDKDKNLIAGWHRLQAYILKKWPQIPCIISDKTDEMDKELQQIDENLFIVDLHHLDRGHMLARREEIYKLKHPETKVGQYAKVNPPRIGGKLSKNPDSGILVKSTPTFAEETSEKMGISKTVIAEEVQIVKNLIPEAEPIIKQQDRPKIDSLHLARQTPAVQKKVTELMPERPNTPMKNIVKEVKHEEKKQEILKNLPKPIEASKAPLVDYRMYWGDMFEYTKSPGILKFGTIPLIITSPPYAVGKDYAGAGDWDAEKWPEKMELIAKRVARELTDSGVFALILGTQPKENKGGIKEYIPLDSIAIPLCRKAGLFLLRRAYWTFNAGKSNTGGGKNLNGRYETISFFVKGPGYTFNLKDVMVPPKDPNEPRNSPYGANPGDVWEAGEEWHFERTTNVEKYAKCIEEAECILPYDLVERIIKLFSKPGDIVMDPFAGSAIVMRVAADLGRKAICIEINKQMAGIVGLMMDPIPFAQEDVGKQSSSNGG